MEIQNTNDYSKDYENQLLRGVEEGKPWDQVTEVLKISKPTDLLLDIGCGTAKKLKDIAPRVQKIIGLEPGEQMLEQARENIASWRVNNVTLVKGTGESLPFDDNQFDIVTCMLAVHDTREVWRVLKPGGVAILEKIGDRDKWNLKKEFGRSKGTPVGEPTLQQRFVDGAWRGCYTHFEEGKRAELYQVEFNEYFTDVRVSNAFWKTYYSLEGWIRLCENTPTVRDFDRINDSAHLKAISQKYSTPKGIETKQNRILIIAKKPERN